MGKTLLHITLWLDYGGLEKIVYDSSRKLNQEGYNVHIVALEKGGAIYEQLKQSGFSVTMLGRRPGKFDIRLLGRLVRLIKDLKVDVIHSHGCLMYAALAGRLAGVTRIIHTEHGRYLPDSLGRIWEDRIFSRLISKYICVSKELEEYMIKIKVSPRKLATIINGIDTTCFYKYSEDEIFRFRDKYNIHPTDIVLGTISRLIKHKNIGFLIQWIKKNINIYKNLRLIIVGDGEEYRTLVSSARGLPSGTVQFHGARADIPDILNIFDIFALPSITEGTSLAILEAMSTELPVIASEVGGNKDIINHGETGFLFKVNDMESFGHCIDKVVSNKQIRDKMGLNARQLVEQKYSFNKMFTKYSELYL